MTFWVYTAIQVDSDLQDFPAPYLYRGSLWPWRLVICWMMKTMVTTVSRILTMTQILASTMQVLQLGPHWTRWQPS